MGMVIICVSNTIDASPTLMLMIIIDTRVAIANAVLDANDMYSYLKLRDTESRYKYLQVY